MKQVLLIVFAVVVVLAGCKNSSEQNESAAKQDTFPAQNASPGVDPINDSPGIIGIIEVPEILTLAVRDSATEQEIGFKMGKAYSAIESDMIALNLSNNDMPPGVLYYTNDPKNFVFECVVPINAMPTKQPEKSTVVVLEATRAVVYNYYGPYNKMMNAYAELKDYLEKNKLEQTGPSREFYLTDASVEKNPGKWLSKIYIPVK